MSETEYFIASAFKGLLVVKVPKIWVQQHEIAVGGKDNKVIVSHIPTKRSWELWVTHAGAEVTQHNNQIPFVVKPEPCAYWESYAVSQMFGRSGNSIILE